MQDLNDLYLFAQVVEHGGFAAAARHLDLPRSRLSRRIGLLEERLGVRLVQRTTRHFAVTEVGREYHRHCLAMLVQAEAAQESIDRSRAQPRGTVRVSCPSTLLIFQVGPMVTDFMASCPDVMVELKNINRQVDVIGEGYDVVFRVRFSPLDDTGLIMRELARSPQRLVASPVLLNGRSPASLTELSHLPSLSWTSRSGDHTWHLTGLDDTKVVVAHRPRLITEDMLTLRHAALQGLGVVQLPLYIVQQELAAGDLDSADPSGGIWGGRDGVISQAAAGVGCGASSGDASRSVSSSLLGRRLLSASRLR